MNTSDVRRFNKTTLSRYGGLLAFLAMAIVFSFAFENFLTVRNMMLVLTESAIVSILCIGTTFCIASGEFDLSAGSVCGLAGVATAIAFRAGYSTAAAIGIGLLVGLGCGAINAFLVTVIRIPSLIATVATNSIALGINYALSGAVAVVADMSDGFLEIGQGTVLGIPIPVAILVVLFVIGCIILDKTRVGMYIYAVGGNPTAARLSGIELGKYKTLAFAIGGFMSAVSGIIGVSLFASAQPMFGQTFTLEAIAAVYVGMTMIREGEPHLLGSMIGILLMTIINNGFTLGGIPYYYQDIAKGFIIILAIAAAVWRKRAD